MSFLQYFCSYVLGAIVLCKVCSVQCAVAAAKHHTSEQVNSTRSIANSLQQSTVGCHVGLSSDW